MTNIASYAQDVLAQNDEGRWTYPNNKTPNQHVWDSIFAALAYSRTDSKRAVQEIESILQGQWSDGMVPHIIFESDSKKSGAHSWRSKVSTNAPQGIATSGITQPPLLAEAAYQIAHHVPNDELQPFLSKIVPALYSYHSWLYDARDTQSTGLISTFTTSESRLDNFPMENQQLPLLKGALNNGTDSQTIKLFRKHGYDWGKISQLVSLDVKSVTFNAILVRNNSLLSELSKMAHIAIPDDLKENMEATQSAFDRLWDDNFNEYFHFDTLTKQSIPHTTVATIVALYSGIVPQKRIAEIVQKLHDAHAFQAKYPVPTNPQSRPYFHANKAWNGATHQSVNWLIYDGLKRVGLRHEASLIRDASMQLFEQAGAREYYSSSTGEGFGAHDFSVSAAVYLLFASENNNS